MAGGTDTMLCMQPRKDDAVLAVQAKVDWK